MFDTQMCRLRLKVDDGNRNQRRDGSGTRGRERKITWVPVSVPYRSRPDQVFPSRLLHRVPLVLPCYEGINKRHRDVGAGKGTLVLGKDLL